MADEHVPQPQTQLGRELSGAGHHRTRDLLVAQSDVAVGARHRCGRCRSVTPYPRNNPTALSKMPARRTSALTAG